MAKKSNTRKIREYQEAAIKAMLSVPEGESGQVILPTGSGKTVIGEEFIKRKAEASKEKTVSAVFVPRLLLGKQWIRRSAINLLQQSGMPFAFVNINSGGVSDEVKKIIEDAQYLLQGAGTPKLRTTTDPSEVRAEINSLRKKYHVIALSTYHSSSVVRDSGVRFDSGLFDECQYLVSTSRKETEYRISMQIPMGARFFMTATPRTTSSTDGQGMNNEKEFGPVIFERKPREIIEAGAIVSPKMHLIGSEHIVEGLDHDSRMRMIYRALERHHEEVRKNSAEPDKIAGKLLVTCDGQLTLEGLLNSKVFREIRRNDPELKIFALCSSYGIYLNGRRIPPPVSNNDKEEFLAALDALGHHERAIILHVDMIAEGLDVPGITGVMPLRNSSRIKLIQILGRSSRLHPEDANGIFETGKLKPCDYSNYIKPNCYVVIPYALDNRDDFLERNATLIDALRTEYGFDPSENVVCDIIHPEQQGPDWDEDKLARQVRSSAIASVNEFYQIMEDEAMTVDRLIQINKLRRFTPEQIEQFIAMSVKH